jgi:RNA polymerase sigma factor (sigma-70 family)
LFSNSGRLNIPLHKNYSEQELIAALQNREQQAMSVLYDRYSKALFNIIYRIVENQEMSEDVLQESFVKIWNSIAQYNGDKGTIFTWMLNICRNSAIDKVRSKEFRNVSKNQNVDGNVNLSEYRTEFNPDTLGLKTITERLKPEQKEIVDLIYFNGYTHVEVAEQLNLPLGTVKTRLRMAIMELRNYFN